MAVVEFFPIVVRRRPQIGRPPKAVIEAGFGFEREDDVLADDINFCRGKTVA